MHCVMHLTRSTFVESLQQQLESSGTTELSILIKGDTCASEPHCEGHYSELL